MIDAPKQPIRARLRRLYVAEGVYFITAVTQYRRPHFAQQGEIDRLRAILRQVKRKYPFKMNAFVFLSDHFHLLLRVQPQVNISQVMHSLKRNYTVQYKAAKQMNQPLKLWQAGFWDHVIRDERDYRNHLDYIHKNPVKHGYVSCPEDYQHSSYLEYVRRGWYDIGWGHDIPPNRP